MSIPARKVCACTRSISLAGTELGQESQSTSLVGTQPFGGHEDPDNPGEKYHTGSRPVEIGRKCVLATLLTGLTIKIVGDCLFDWAS